MAKFNGILRSVFIGAVVIVPLVASVIAISRIIEGPGVQASLLLIASGLVLGFFAYLFVGNVPRTEKNLNLVTWMVILSFVGQFMEYNRGEGDLGLFLWNFGILVIWLLYVYWYSRLTASRRTRIKEGSVLPSFEMKNVRSEVIRSSDLAGNPSLFMFFRGNWCPLCMAQVREVAEGYRELESRGVRVFLVSPQPEEFTRKLAHKMDVPFEFIVDRNNDLARQLGIVDEFGLPLGFQALGYDSDVPAPTVIITNPMNVIIFLEVADNYRVRPEPETFLKVLDEAGFRGALAGSA